jgi:uncharacterized protein (DUF1697 family)
MPRYVAFLRGINVAGQKRIRMEELKVLFEVYSFDEVETYIQSGNVAFDTDEVDTEKIRASVEHMLKESYQYEIITLIRSQDELELIIDANPFEEREDDDDVKLYVNFLSEQPDQSKVALLKELLKANERMELVGREIYLQTPAYGDTKLSNGIIEKKLGVSATARNWATINRVVDL